MLGIGIGGTLRPSITKSAKSFGVKGDGVSIDTAAIQNAVDSLKPSAGTWTGGVSKSGVIFFPAGTYLIDATIEIWTGVYLVGEGPATIFKSTSDFTGDNIFECAAVSAGYYGMGGVVSCSFQNAGTVFPWCIGQSSGVVINSTFDDILLTGVVKYGLNFDTYIQHSTISRISSGGNVEQILYMTGNHNAINKIDKEGNSGSTTEPYVHIVDCESLDLKGILLEGTGSVNKVPLKIEGSKCVLENYWCEVSTNNGYSIDVTDSYVNILGNFIIKTSQKINLTNSKLIFDALSFDSNDNPPRDFIDFDSTSRIRILQGETRRQHSQQLSTPQLIINNHRTTTNEGQTGYYNNNILRESWGGNLLENPSFEAGRFGWSLDASGGSTVTEEYIASDIGGGLMGHFVLDANGLRLVRQNFTITAGMVGHPLTLSGAVKLVDNSGIVRLVMSGVGIDSGYATGSFRFNTSSSVWQKTSATIIPQTTGSLTVGLYVTSGIEWYWDDFSLRFGVESESAKISNKMIDLDGHSITYNSAAPTSGTWRVGDIVYNSAPSASGTIGWVCVTAGAPGTWKTFGTIAS